MRVPVIRPLEPEDGRERREELAEALAGLDALLVSTTFFSGRAFGLADIAYLPWLLRLRDLMGVSLEPFPAICGWLARCAERPSVAAEVETVATLAA